MADEQPRLHRKDLITKDDLTRALFAYLSIIHVFTVGFPLLGPDKRRARNF